MHSNNTIRLSVPLYEDELVTEAIAELTRGLDVTGTQTDGFNEGDTPTVAFTGPNTQLQAVMQRIENTAASQSWEAATERANR